MNKNDSNLGIILECENHDSTSKKDSQIQAKKMGLVCYLSLEDVEDKLMLLSNLKFYAYIKHDKDSDVNGEIEKEHIHIYLEFSKKVDVNKVAKLFNIATNLVELIYNPPLYLQYFIHKNDKDKYQYSSNDIDTNIPHINDILFNIDRKANAFKVALYLLDTNPNLTYSYYLSTLIDKGFSDLIFKHSYLFKSLFDSYYKK